MKASYKAYMREIEPTAAFNAALEARMRRALYASRRRSRRVLAGVAAAMLALAALAVLLPRRPAPEDHVAAPAAPTGTAAPAAETMTAERAIELVKLADRAAADAAQFWVYPDGAGAWVFYATGWQDALFDGAFWYAAEGGCAALSGPVDGVRQWQFIEDPGIFTWNRLADGADALSAFTVVDGAPLAVRTGSLVSLEGRNGLLYGMAAANDYDYAFLSLSGGVLKAVEGARVDARALRDVAAVRALLDELLPDEGAESRAIGECYYFLPSPGRWPESPHASAGCVAVNLTLDGAAAHAYLWIAADGTVEITRGWEREASALDGAASAARDVGLETEDIAAPPEADSVGTFNFEADGVTYVGLHHMDGEGSWFSTENRMEDTSPDFDDYTPEYAAFVEAEDAAKDAHLAACPLFWLGGERLRRDAG